MTPTENVAKISTAVSKAEGFILKAIAELAKVEKPLEEIHMDGPAERPEGVKPFGRLEMLVYAAQFGELSGDLSSVLAGLVGVHQDTYERAVELGIDDGIGVFGGGGR